MKGILGWSERNEKVPAISTPFQFSRRVLKIELDEVLRTILPDGDRDFLSKWVLQYPNGGGFLMPHCSLSDASIGVLQVYGIFGAKVENKKLLNADLKIFLLWHCECHTANVSIFPSWSTGMAKRGRTVRIFLWILELTYLKGCLCQFRTVLKYFWEFFQFSLPLKSIYQQLLRFALSMTTLLATLKSMKKKMKLLKHQNTEIHLSEFR